MKTNNTYIKNLKEEKGDHFNCTICNNNNFNNSCRNNNKSIIWAKWINRKSKKGKR